MEQPKSAVAGRQQELAQLVNPSGGHGQVAILIDELCEITAMDLPVERAAALVKAKGHPGKQRDRAAGRD